VSPRVPRVNASEMSRALEKLGFRLVRQSGSHRIYRNAAGNRVTLPFHSGKILHPKVLKSIMVDADLTVEALIELLKGL
jgi:predicted RNA binding protein YcfA (HicA-like mRNA interferase family)